MSKRHIIGPTSAPHYPQAAVAGWCALGAQEAMDVHWHRSLRLQRCSVAGNNARLFWGVAERLGLVVQ